MFSEKKNSSDKSECQNCATGKRIYEIDNRAPFCPYLEVHKGENCAMYVALDEKEQAE